MARSQYIYVLTWAEHYEDVIAGVYTVKREAEAAMAAHNEVNSAKLMMLRYQDNGPIFADGVPVLPSK